MKGHWIQCTPGFLEQWPNSCGPAIRRPTLEACTCNLDKTVPHVYPIGHEHLLVRVGGVLAPLEHESGQPA